MLGNHRVYLSVYKIGAPRFICNTFPFVEFIIIFPLFDMNIAFISLTEHFLAKKYETEIKKHVA